MASIVISGHEENNEFISKLVSSLSSLNHNVSIMKLREGEYLPNNRDYIRQALKQVDAFVVLLSKKSIFSKDVEAEIKIAKSIAGYSDIIKIIPVIIDNTEISFNLSGYDYIFLKDKSIDDLAIEIGDSVDSHKKRLKRMEEEKEKKLTAVKVDLAAFVKEAISNQKEYAADHKKSAQQWYKIGYSSLIAGLFATIISGYVSFASSADTFNYARAISVSFLNIILISILAALARYAYSLGKSYMSESLKASDRIHAIQFGEFFLQAYGTQASSMEVREVFQHWNIDRNSTFSSLDSAQIDPQIAQLIVQIVSAISGKVKS